ncbi:hypothetical protein Tco_0404613 [Tanacetum coccineum]
MEPVSAQVFVAAKLPVLNPGEFELWKMRIEQYFLMTNYALWEVILNGDSPLSTRTVDGVETSFNTYKSAKTLMEAIEKRFGEDVNLKLLRSLPSKWKTHTLIWRNKPDLEDLSMDDLYNNLKIYEDEIMGSSSTNQNTQNVAFMSSNITSNTNEAVTTAHGVSDANSKNNASNLPNVDNLKQIDPDDLEEMDLKWQMAMLANIAKRFLKKTRRNLGLKEEPTNFALMAYTSSSSSAQDTESQLNVGAYKAGLESVEARLDVYKKNEAIFEEDIKILKLDIMLRDNALTKLRKKFEKAEKERDDLKLTLEKFENSSKNLSKLLDRYHAIPPPYTGNFMRPKLDLVLADKDEYVFSESTTSVPSAATSEVKTSVSKPKSVGEPLIEDWISEVRMRMRLGSPLRRDKVTTAGPKAVVSDKKGNEANTIKALACWVWSTKNTKYLDHVIQKQWCQSRALHKLELQKKALTGGALGTLTGNNSTSYMSEKIDGGFCCLCVSQMCDKKNSVLFTDTECVVLSSDFKLTNENHVLLKVPRKDNMYSVDLRNVVFLKRSNLSLCKGRH